MKGNRDGLFAIRRSDTTNDAIFRHRIGGMDPAPLIILVSVLGAFVCSK